MDWQKSVERQRNKNAWTLPIVGNELINEFLARIDQCRENRRHIDIQVVQPKQIVQAVH